MGDQNDDFNQLLEGTSLGSRGARELRARTPAFRSRAVRSIAGSGWWHRYADVLPNWYPTYVGLEEAASLIRTHEVHFVPGLLQTKAYARAIMRSGSATASEGEVERLVAARLERQKRLVSETPPLLHVVLDESLLRRPYGGREVMRDQLHHLIGLSEVENVRLQIRPLDGGRPSGAGAFTILTFPEPDLSDIVYLEQLTSALYLDKRQEVDEYESALRGLQEDSLVPDKSRDLLWKLMRLF
ncbi:DUF5753 domain-containing protein [Streptomyces sp. S07_1.15]|uniref:DUF5753 domain-containing protein n=1 Tax=Streptomyces sp. S07_1.15 TaxID=2873925 RepID=UPI001D1484E9|nr:DUF5753 domain-containing protein [Streptomyces sp. S07_1.15]MCC3655849.1 DUF5753 domain-containing protein [Streptomyces sp. S07_1.15]